MSTVDHPPPQSTDEQCAYCAQVHRCHACFEELVRRFQPPLLHFLTRRRGSRHDAEDLLQETFLAVYRNLHRYQSAWRFSTWAFTIANRLAVSSRRRRSLTDGNNHELAEKIDKSNPSQNAQENERCSALWDAARRILDPDSFTAIWLNYVESMPCEQIGLVLGRSANAVRILLHRARLRLEKQLDSSQRF